MPIPTVDEIMLPLLRFLSDGKEHTNQELADKIAIEFSLSPAEKAERQRSGKSRFNNYIRWGIVNLKNAGLIENTRRAVVRITPRCQFELAKKPAALTEKYLKQFPEFLAFKNLSRPESVASSTTSQGTPEEQLEAGYLELKELRKREILERISKCTPSFFEKLVLDLLLKMDYGGGQSSSGKITGRSGDGGIDGEINEDALGLDKIAFQAKRYASSNVIGVPTVRDFIGSLDTKGFNKGILITTSVFTQEARSLVSRAGKKIVLLDGAELSELLFRYGVGLSKADTYETKDIDEEYFEEGFETE